MTTAVLSLLVAGTSHVGKSTLSAAVGEAVGWDVVSTDRMARHPGRPWPDVPPHVAEFYAMLSHDSIFQFLLHHHSNMWPRLECFLSDRQVTGEKCILEGSALRPEYLAHLPRPQNLCVCLCASPDALRDRIHENCMYASLSVGHQSMVDKFAERTIRDNEANMKASKEWGIDCIDTSDWTTIARLRAKLIETLKDG